MTKQETVPIPTFFWTERTVKCHPGGHTLTEIIPIDGVMPDDFPGYIITVQVQVGRHPNGQPIIATSKKGFNAESIEAAFGMVPGLVDEMAKATRAEFLKKQIVVPSPTAPVNGRLKLTD